MVQKYGQLQYDPEKDVLRGRWYASNCQLTGEILLFRSKTRFNYYDNLLSKRMSLEELQQQLAQGEAPLAEQVATLDVAPILFVFGRATLSPASQTYLTDELVPLLRKHPRLILDIKGFTDSSADDTVNLILSRDRAKAVFDHLLAQGIPAERMSYQGMGEAQPLAPNDTPEGRSKNRRVELSLYIP
ncbi:MAG: hypothetical protein OHK0039_06100 [Bacteroidia bacterium]